MALYGGGDRTRTGPYWRRQTHTTLPGERTAEELALVNALRARSGQQALGGPAPPRLLGPPAGGGYGIPERPQAGAQQGGLEQLQLPQLLALRAMLAKVQGQPRQAGPAPPRRGVLPQLHRAVPVRSHVRIVQPQPDPYPGY